MNKISESKISESKISESKISESKISEGQTNKNKNSCIYVMVQLSSTMHGGYKSNSVFSREILQTVDFSST